MMKIVEHQSLQSLNTFGFNAAARYFVEANTNDDVIGALTFAEEHNLSFMVLGEGSNVVMAKDFAGLLLKLCNNAVEVLSETADEVILRVGAGKNWHELVSWTLEQGFYGLENLSLIPGSVGAAPVQNIGAYGVELKDRFHSLEAVDRQTKNLVTLNRADCQFGYRDSLFKQQGRDRYIICHVNFRLTKHYELNTCYGAVAAEIDRQGLEHTPLAVSQVVCQLRQAKLPDPKRIGNAGSFFKNPVITNEHCEHLRVAFPHLVSYADKPGFSKLAAGWLIEQCGWKGHREQHVGVHADQALVLVNYGGGQASELLALADRIKASVKECFGVVLEMEPTIYPTPC